MTADNPLHSAGLYKIAGTLKHDVNITDRYMLVRAIVF